MVKGIVFDSGPIISLAMNNLLWILTPLKQYYKGEFYIVSSAHRELIDNALQTKRFKFEALQLLKMLNEGTLSVINDPEIENIADDYLELANSSFIGQGRPLVIAQRGEIESLAAAAHLQCDAVAIDERTTRLLIENPLDVRKLLQRKMNIAVAVNKGQLNDLVRETHKVKVLRSAEIVLVAYHLGFLDDYIPKLPNGRALLLEGLLWGVKLSGCAISEKEIEELLSLLA